MAIFEGANIIILSDSTKEVSSEQQPMTAQLPFGVGVVAAGSGGGRPM